jgi:hypothetical protein
LFETRRRRATGDSARTAAGLPAAHVVPLRAIARLEQMLDPVPDHGPHALRASSALVQCGADGGEAILSVAGGDAGQPAGE